MSFAMLISVFWELIPVGHPLYLLLCTLAINLVDLYWWLKMDTLLFRLSLGHHFFMWLFLLKLKSKYIIFGFFRDHIKSKTNMALNRGKTQLAGADPGFLEGGANSRQQSLGWRCTPSMLELRDLGACFPRKIFKIDAKILHVACVNVKVLVDNYILSQSVRIPGGYTPRSCKVFCNLRALNCLNF